ncbi:LysM domain-containing protein [Cryobacterium frigoriphilum]|uniref:LysM domain-containing protein n=1 Tax=Cryobacterium frigoriphilum TaxID=1259150 RepID=A0A4R8ZVE4_9MICO|nr:LysM domain-containing protein [Cryobacterium frigoriphilum]TFD47334.1 LysM domain-containing protein [Cryobacterium frigoriphilum]
MRRVALLAPALLLLVGCAGEPAPVVTVTITPTVEPSPSPSATPTPTPTVEPEPVMTAEPEAELIPNPQVPTIVPNAEPEPLPQGPAMDLGATAGARGSAVANGAGALITYQVVEGDSFFDIAQRFNVPVQLMLTMNPSVPGLGENIYINQTINLDWTAKL